MNTQQRNQEMARLRYEERMPVNTIAKRFDLSPSHVYRITADKSDLMTPTSDGLSGDQLFREFGVTGLSRWSTRSASIVEDGLPELRDLTSRAAIYNEMYHNNAVVRAVLFAMEWVMREVEFFAEPASDKPEDVAAAEFLDECLHDMSFSWDDELSMILWFWVMGFQPMEIVYKRRLGRDPGEGEDGTALPRSQYDDGRISWRKWAPRPADTLAPGNEWIFDDAGGIQGIRQQAAPDWKLRTIPIEKLLLFRTTVAPKNSPEGISLLRYQYVNWYLATNLQEIEAIGAERDLVGMPIIYLGTDTSKEGTNSDYDLSKDIVRNLRRDEQEGIVIPFPKMTETEGGRGMLVELLRGGGERQFDVDKIINRHEKRMAMSVLAQWVFLGMERIGTQALATVHGDFFTVALDGWARSITATISRHGIPRLFDFNTFNVNEAPRLTHTSVGTPDLDAMADYVNSLVDKDVLTPDDQLESYLRQIARLPDIPDDEAMPAEPEADSARKVNTRRLSSSRVRDVSLLLQRQIANANKLLERGSIDTATADAMIAPALQGLREMGVIGNGFSVQWGSDVDTEEQAQSDDVEKQAAEPFVPAEDDQPIVTADTARVDEDDIDRALAAFDEWLGDEHPELAGLLDAELVEDDSAA